MFFSRTTLAIFGALFSLASLASAPSCDEKSTPLSAQDEKSTANASIDGQRALQYIKDIVSFGPRHAGTIGAEKTRQYIIDKLKSFGLRPKRDDFTAFTPHPDLKHVKMANITADIGGTSNKKKVLIGGHFDGKLIPGILFQGANDGGSSTALLLELGRILALQKPPMPVRLAFFDGEEALVDWSDSDSLYGSKHMATELKEKGEERSFAAAVIVDMIGDQRLKLNRDTASAPQVLSTIVNTAKRLGYSSMFHGDRGRIEDDHLPFLSIGIPACVLIDLNYGPEWTSNAYWHTELDTIDKLSGESIEAVGNVVLQSLAELASP